MADKRGIKRTIKRLDHIKTWQLLVLLVLSVFVSATFLRLNNVGMVQRRDAVLDADSQNDVEAMANRLYDLQVYAASHMNASSGDIYLTKKYARDVQHIVEEARTSTDAGMTVFKQADNICKPQFTTWSEAYVACVAAELDKLPASKNTGVLTVHFPSPALYHHAYISPLWSADFAGLSVLLSLFLAIVVIIRIISGLVLRALLHWKYRSA